MKSALKTWRQERREATYFDKAMKRSSTMRPAEIVETVDLSLMTASQAISRYRRSSDAEYQMDQLREVRLDLEAALGMLDNVVKQ